MLHSPVLLEESIDFLITNPSGKYIDATFGRGGHSRKILDSITKDGTLLALDKDIDAIRFAKENFKDKNFSIEHTGFEDLDSINSAKQLTEYYLILDFVPLIMMIPQEALVLMKLDRLICEST